MRSADMFEGHAWGDRFSERSCSRILLVSHEASRSGAPRIAALVARSLIDQGSEVRIVSRTQGPMMDDFQAVAPTSVEFFYRVRRRLRVGRLTRRVARAADSVVAAGTIVRYWPDVVYVNSTAAAIYLAPAIRLRRRVVLHVHESGPVAKQFLRAVGTDLDLAGVEVVACSSSVQIGLAALLGRDPRAIPLLASVPDDGEVRRRSVAQPDHSYQDKEFIIGCCGTVEARKGADLWVAAARLVLATRPDHHLRFVWVGDIAEPVETAPEEPIDFIGPSANPWAHMRRFDIVTLPSRDDPFPLVVLESMILGRPVAAFGVGGVPQQLGEAGLVVEPGDVVGLAEALIALVDNPDLRATLGSAARDRAASSYSYRDFDEKLNTLMRGLAEHAHRRDASTRRCEDVDGP